MRATKRDDAERTSERTNERRIVVTDRTNQLDVTDYLATYSTITREILVISSSLPP